jgi:hypothetical protein
MTSRILNLPSLLAAVVACTFASVAVSGPEPDYGEYRGPVPTAGQNTEGPSYRPNSYGQIGSGATLPGSLGGSTVTVPEGLINSGSYGVPAPGSGKDILHQDEVRRLRNTYATKKARQKQAKHGDHGTSSSLELSPEPHIVVIPSELTSPLDRNGSRPVATPRRSVVRDHAVAAHPKTPGQGGARRDRTIPTTSAGPSLGAYPREGVAVPQPTQANVAGVAWGRPVCK